MSKISFLERFKSGTIQKHHINVMLDNMLNSTDWIVRKDAAGSHYANTDHLDKALNDAHGFVVDSAVKNPNVTSKHLDKALEMYHNDSVRESVAKHPKASKDHLDKALIDSCSYVRLAARKNKNYKKYYPNGHEQ